MVVVLRGVRMFSGLRTEEGGERPLREVTRVCGLALGGEDLFDGRDFGRKGLGDRRQHPQCVRLATLDGQLVRADDQAIDGCRVDEGFATHGLEVCR